MTEEQALLAAVRAAPDDDLPRLVYADWLDERGRGVRAEFIRLQCRIAELQRGCLCGACVRLRGGGQHQNGPCAIDRDRVELPDGRTRQAFLRQRERDLLASHAVVEWLAPSPTPHPPHVGGGGQFGWSLKAVTRLGDSYIPVTFRRGFVAEVICTLNDWCGNRVPLSDGNGTWFAPGIGTAVVVTHPIQTARITDRNPVFGASPMFRWTDASEPNPLYSFRSHPQNQLPHDVFRMVKGNMVVPNQSPYIKWFATKDEAEAALSVAIIAWAKKQSGRAATPTILPITPPETAA